MQSASSEALRKAQLAVISPPTEISSTGLACRHPSGGV
jgi:hypothetical protein